MLLGTDTLPGLGFSFLQKESDGRSVELLTKQDNEGRTAGQEPVDNSSDLDQPGHPEPPNTEEVATVTMLHAARVPARHSKLVRVTVVDQNIASGSTLLFEPNLTRKGLLCRMH